MFQTVFEPEALEYYYDHALEFVEDNMVWPARKFMPGFEITPQQRDLLIEVPKEKRISVESGHGSGKSTSYSWIAYWFMITRHNVLGNLVKIPCVAPTFHQLYDVLWPEFKRWLPLSRFADLFETKMTEVYIKGHKDSTFARATSPKDPDNLQGWHAPHLLWIVDEAFGITNEQIWETIEGSITQDDNRMIIGGQHTIIVGYVHDTFNRDKEGWKNLRFNSEESPIANKAFINRIANKYGKNSDVYRVRVLGMAPRGNPNSLLQLEDVARARNREVDGCGALEMGVDPARFGDDLAVVTIRNGFRVYPQESLSSTDTKELYDLTIQTLRKYRIITRIQSKAKIKVDNSGGYGAGLIDMLSINSTDNIEVVPVDFGGTGNEEYFDNISMMFGELKDVINEIQLPDDNDLELELVARTYTYQKKFGRDTIRVQSKKEYKKDHGGESPDKADSLLLSFTQRAPDVRVFHEYSSTDPNCSRNFDIMKALEIKVTGCPAAFIFGVLIFDKGLGLYGNMFSYHFTTKELYIYAEFVHTAPTLEQLVVDIRRKAEVSLDRENNIHVEGFWANKEVFDVGHNARYYMMRNKIRLKESNYYNELGAIQYARDMFCKRKIIVHSSLQETDYQYRGWVVRGRKPIPGFPICQALLVGISELRHKKIIKPEEVYEEPYSQRKKSIHDHLYAQETDAAMTMIRKQKTIDDYLTS